MKLFRLAIIAGMIVAMIFFSLSFVWYKEVYRYFLPITTVILRLGISGLLLLIISFAIGKFEPVRGRYLAFMALAAFFEPFLYFVGESYGMLYISPSLAAAIISTIPLFCPLPAFYFLKEKISLINLFGLFVSLAGIGLIIFSGEIKIQASLKGILLLFLAVIAAVGYSTAVKKVSEKYNAFTIVTYQNLLGFIYFIPIFLATEFNSFHPANLNANAWVSLMKLTLLVSTLAWILYVTGIKHLGVTRSNMFTNLIPAFTSILAYFMIGEQFSLNKIAGISLVILGLFLSEIQKRQAS
jgi:drug/metabolite transporter (DMT)-like permease